MACCRGNGRSWSWNLTMKTKSFCALILIANYVDAYSNNGITRANVVGRRTSFTLSSSIERSSTASLVDTARTILAHRKAKGVRDSTLKQQHVVRMIGSRRERRVDGLFSENLDLWLVLEDDWIVQNFGQSSSVLSVFSERQSFEASKTLATPKNVELCLQLEAAKKRASSPETMNIVSASKVIPPSSKIRRVQKLRRPRKKLSAVTSPSKEEESTGQRHSEETTSSSSSSFLLSSTTPFPITEESESSQNDFKERDQSLSSSLSHDPKQVIAIDKSSSGSVPSLSSSGVNTAEGITPRRRLQKKIMTHRNARVSPNEEREIARVVQAGARLQKLKANFEADHGRDITQAEWVELSGLKNRAELRRAVQSYRTAKAALVEANMGLVYSCVRKMVAFRSDQRRNEEELVQEGTLGLIRAAELFDPERGLKFSTYATIWIKGVLGNTHVGQTIVVPTREKTKWNKVMQAEKELALLASSPRAQAYPKNDQSNDAKHPDSPGSKITSAQIATRTGLKESEVEDLRYRMTRTQQPLSLDHRYKVTGRSGAPEGESGSSGLYNVMHLKDRDQDELTIEESVQLKADIMGALERNLDERSAQLMKLRYGLEEDGKVRTLVDCAAIMGLSKQRVQQIASKSLEQLREADDFKSLQEYLLNML